VAGPSTIDPARQETSRLCDAWLALQRALAFEPERAGELLRRWRDPRAVLAAAGLMAEVVAGEAAQDRAALVGLGARVLPWPSDAYPERLRPLVDAPPVLCLRGDPSVLGRPCVALVGARAATVDGLLTARTLAFELARRGLVVVSGLARGIDAAAHRGALEAGGPTIAVQACGLDQVYPREHRELAAEIARSGAVVSELPIGAPPRAAHFPLRNRVISGLSLATVVVEARLRSGSLVTASHALAQGRDVLAVPGPLRAPTSEGPHRLLRDGARPMLDVDDVLAVLPEPVLTGLVPLTEATAPAGSRRASSAEVREGARKGSRASARALDERDRALLDALDHEAQARDGLTRSLSWTVPEVAARLLSLELDGWVHQDRDGRFRRRRADADADTVAKAKAKAKERAKAKAQGDTEPPARA